VRISTFAAVVAGLEILAALYLSWIAFLMAIWFVDDGIAFTMTDADWRRVGVDRFLRGCLAGAVFGALVWFVNRLLGFGRQPGFARCLPWVLTSFFVVASGVGALCFVYERPYF
jgi:hypothetical protein